MNIAGLQKCSFVDYPGKLAAVVFTPGCNMNCFYCHNPGLLGAEPRLRHETADVLAFLERRRGMLDAVVVTGGEPTLQADLPEFLRQVRAMGFAVKLDTNGTRPEVLGRLIAARLVDSVAMDVKASPRQYHRVAGVRVDLDAIDESILTLLGGRVDYEFRTTFAPPLRATDLCQIASHIAGARRYAIQQYRPQADNPLAPLAHSDAYVRSAARLVMPFVDEVVVRGLGHASGAAGEYRPVAATRLANTA